MKITSKTYPDLSPNSNQPAPESLIRVAILMSLPRLLREFGHDPAVIMNSVGLDLDILNSPETKIPFETMGKLFAQCVKTTQCEHFGLLVGESIPASLLGITGFVMQHADDVQTALNDWIRYLVLHDQGAIISLTHGNNLTLMGYSIYKEDVEAAGQIYEGSMVVGCNVLQELCGPAWRPVEILFTHKQPKDISRHRKVFKGPLRFNTGQNAIVFSSHWLTTRPERSDPLLYRYLTQQAEQLLSAAHSGLIDQLGALLRILLLSQKCTLAEATRQLGMHARTLERRLRAESTCFRDEVAKTRYVMARQLLAESSLSVGDIAEALSYANASAFVHAFKRWSGKAPGAWRKYRPQGTIGTR